MFSPKYYDRYLDDQFYRQHYGTKLKLKKFDTEEFQSLSYSVNSPLSLGVISSKVIDDEKLVPIAVDIKNVSFHYNSFSSVLNDITLQMPQGKIYALLGASGCGKTTLLRIILGRLKPLTGSVRIFDETPGTHASQIPGTGVGYMPQELALFKLLTINEVLHYYGRIYGMDSLLIRSRVEHFIQLLNLPNKHRKVSQLSGGQQRRVSLAVTLVHKPPFLILDEPTVGVDSLLRLRIWNYLEDLCKNEKTTVLITTHYTEEARNAYRVGFIDSGIMLAQDNPERLILKYNCYSLEDVFLELCLQKSSINSQNNNNNNINDNSNSNINSNVNSISNSNNDSNNDSNNNNQTNGRQISHQMHSLAGQVIHEEEESSLSGDYQSATVPKHTQNYSIIRKKNKKNLEPKRRGIAGGQLHFPRLYALLKKNYILFKRNPVSIILLNILPIIQIALYCVSFQRNPQKIPIAVVNHDNHTSSLSNLFLSRIDNETIFQVPHRSTKSAINSIHTVHSWLALRFPKNFTRNFRRRFTKPERISKKTIEGSKIQLYPDNAHTIFSLYTYRALIDAFESFIREVGSALGYNPAFFSAPIALQEPVYGTYKIAYGEYMAAGMIISIVHGMTMLIASFSVVREKSDGHLERSFVAGVRPTEIILSNIIYLAWPVLSQVCVIIGISFFVFEMRLQGSLLEVFILALLSAFQGLIFGIAVSILSPSEVACLIVVFCIEIPLLFTSGTLYPLETLPSTIRNLMIWNPLTLPISSCRDIMLRGWSFTHFRVALGLLSSITYSVVVTVFCFVFFQLMNHY